MSGSSDRIIVVGAGPVGLTAALALARRGIPTMLLAAEPDLVMELRGSHVAILEGIPSSTNANALLRTIWQQR